MTEQQNTRPSGSREIAVKPLRWSDVFEPDGGKTSSYTHVIAETPLGRVKIEWKGWKEYDCPTCVLPWENGFVCGDNLDHCKQLVQEAFQGIVDALTHTTPTNTEHPTEQPSVRDAARVLLDAIPQRYRIAERIHQNTDASSVGTIELALQNALRTLAQEGE